MAPTGTETPAVPPKFIPDSMQYSLWKKEVNMWSHVTNITKSKQGVMVALYSLPPGSKIKDNVMEQLGEGELKNERGLENLMKFLDKIYQKNDIFTARDKFNEFLYCELKDFESMDEYIMEHNRLYKRVEKFDICKMSSGARGFLLLERAKLTFKEQQFVLTGVNFEESDTLHEQIEASLLKFFGKQATSTIQKQSSITLKEEDSFYTAGYSQRPFSKGNFYRGNRSRGFNHRGGQGRGYGNVQPGPSSPKLLGATGGTSRPKQKKVNLDQYGNIVLCYNCGSKFHLVKECPDRQFSSHQIYETSHDSSELKEKEKDKDENVEDVYAMNLNSALEEVCFMAETVNCAILDSACTSTVCGVAWLTCYMDSLDCENREKVKEYESSTKFRFGNGNMLSSLKRVHIPCTIANKTLYLKTDVVSSDIPLLLGKPTMKKMNMKLDMEHDTVVLCGETIKLDCTPSGHYFIPLARPNIEELNVQDVLHVLDVKNVKDKREAVKHLHRQFGHTTARRLRFYFTKAGIVDKEYMNLIDDVTEKCEICPKWKKTPSRPIVSLPMATEFNETVAMDLKIWNKEKHIYILHLIDLFTRFSISTIITSKDCQVVVDKVMQCWIGTGLGTPEKFLVDNGGEFSGDYFKDMCENLNIMVMHTAADSPFSNGICERNHAVIDEMLMKIMADEPKCRLGTALAWAVHAKNSLHMVSGFSPYQLVYGRNPTIPNVLCNKPPALENTTISKVMMEHLSAIHSSREAFTKAECSERISRALRYKIRSSETVFTQGDIVYYKKDGVREWKGPGKVIGIDGKTLIVKHGVGILRVHSNRAMLKSNSDIIENTNENSSEENEEICKRLQLENQKSSTELGIGSNGMNEEDAVENDFEGFQDNNMINDLDDNMKNDFEGFITSSYIDEADEEILICADITHKNNVMKAKQIELDKWKEFCVYTEVPDIGQPALSCRWVLTEKPLDEVLPIKSRLVARGYEEDLTNSNVRKDSPTAGKPLIKIFFAILATLRWLGQSIDVKAAFLQGKPLDREVFLKPPKEAANMEGKLWKLHKAVYGLNDASRVWYFTIKKCLLDLGCKQVKSDPAMFYWYKENKLSGIFVMHVDDFLYGGTKEFLKLVIDCVKQQFRIGSQEAGAFTYVGLNIQQTDEGIVMNQRSYLKSVQPIEVPTIKKGHSDILDKTNSDNLRSLIGQLNWLGSQTRPDCSFDVLELSISMKQPIKENIVRANKTVKRLKYEDCDILFPDLGNLNQLKLVVFSDASHANLPDGYSSAGGFIVFLVGSNKRCCPLAWEAKKMKRVVKSTLAAETLALVEALDMAFYLGSVLSEIISVKIPIECYVDNKSLWENTQSTKNVTEKRLRIDLASIKEMLQNGEISAIHWVESSNQLSDCFTKRGVSCEKLLNIIKSGNFCI